MKNKSSNADNEPKACAFADLAGDLQNVNKNKRSEESIRRMKIFEGEIDILHSRISNYFVGRSYTWCFNLS